MNIMLDPGHGMGNRSRRTYDPGAVAVHGGHRYEEADLNLLVCAILEIELKKAGHKVRLTRTTKTEQCGLRSRVEKAKKLKSELLISIHHNADPIPGTDEPDGRIKGFQVLHGPNAESKRIAQEVSEAVGDYTPVRVVTARGNLYVLRYQPSILIEMGFIDDPEDLPLITDAHWIRELAEIIAKTLA